MLKGKNTNPTGNPRILAASENGRLVGFVKFGATRAVNQP